MKRLLIILVCISSLFLTACDPDMFMLEENNKNNIEDSPEDEGLSDKDHSGNEYLRSVEKKESLENTDILEVGQSFAIDILTEDFDRLDNLYLYSEEMKEIISFKETHKEIVFHNSNMGDVEKVHEPYTYKYGRSRYIMVPIEASLNNINLLVNFNKDNHIIGFSYEEYQNNTLEKSGKKPEGITEEEFSFLSDNFLIHGTLTSPDFDEDGQVLDTYPLVVLVHGFGPSDRDSSIFENKPFRDIAWGLAEAGIASYRYDKRTYLYDGLENNPVFTVFDETINDAIVAANMAKELKNVNPNKVYILGASQGGYLLPRIASGFDSAAGYILLSSPFQNRKDYLKEQYEYLAMEDGEISLKEHTKINQLNSEIDKLTNPNEIPQGESVLGFQKNYWIDLNRYDPVPGGNRITAPTLVLQGERDYQTTTKQYNLWLNAFGEKENWTFKSYPDLNHFMMKGKGKSYSDEYRQKNYVDSQVIQDIANFIYTN